MEKEVKNTSILRSIKTKVSIVILICVVVALVVNFLILVPNFKSLLSKATENNMLDLSNAYGMLIDEAVTASDDGKVSAADLNALLKDVKVEGIDSSYAYLVD